MARSEAWRGLTCSENLGQRCPPVRQKQKLVDALNYFIKYVGSSPYDAPALLNLMPHIQFGYGLWSWRAYFGLARGLERLLNDLGGRIQYNAEVVGADRLNGRLSALLLAGNQRVAADLFVEYGSNSRLP